MGVQSLKPSWTPLRATHALQSAKRPVHEFKSRALQFWKSTILKPTTHKTRAKQTITTAHPRLLHETETVLSLRRNRTFVTLDSTSSDDLSKQPTNKQQHPCHVSNRPDDLFHCNLLLLFLLINYILILLLLLLLLFNDSIFLFNILFTAAAAWLAFKFCLLQQFSEFNFFLLDILLVLHEQGVQRGNGQRCQCLDATESVAAAEATDS